MVNQTPSVPPADEATLAGVLKTVVRKEMQRMDVMMPVEVVAYDRATNRATVKHLIQMEGSNGEKVDRGQVASVRVFQFGNGAFSMSLPIKPGDKGWLQAADRDLSIFQQDVDKTDAPNTERMHSFQDALFMPDAMKQGDVPAGEGDRVVIGSTGGGTILSFDDDGFYFTVGAMTLKLTEAGFEQIVGGVVTKMTAEGFAQTGGGVMHDSKNIGATHRHSGVEPGSGQTGQPT